MAAVSGERELEQTRGDVRAGSGRRTGKEALHGTRQGGWTLFLELPAGKRGKAARKVRVGRAGRQIGEAGRKRVKIRLGKRASRRVRGKRRPKLIIGTVLNREDGGRVVARVAVKPRR